MKGNDSKSGYDRIMQFASVILIPLSIALAGHLFGIQMKNAELKSQEKRFESEHNLELAKQDANWRITKSELVYKFMDLLTSADEIKRKVAVEAILIALPEDGPRIAQLIAQNDPNNEVKNSASNSIKKQILIIINEIYSENKDIRLDGTNKAISGWLNNDNFITSIISRALSDMANADGVWNTIIYLENIAPEFLRNHKDELENLKSALQNYRGREKTLARLNQNVINKI